MPLQDQFGLPVGSTSATAIQAYDIGIDCQLHAWPGGEQALILALQHDPAFALAHAALALVYQSQGKVAPARAAMAAARQFSSTTVEREHSHVVALSHVVEGRPMQALPAVLAHAQRWPNDAGVVGTALGAFGLFAFSGQADHDAARLQFVRQIGQQHPGDNPWLLTHLSWAHTEAGDAAQGLALIERSLALRPTNGNAAHVMAHARFELNQPSLALSFIDSWLPQYPVEAILFGHLNWHAALCQIDLARIDDAVARLVQVIEPHLAHALPLVGMTDMASLLWRLGLAGRSGLSWAAAQAYAAQRFAKGGNAFVELHLAMLAAARRDVQALQLGRERLQRMADAGHAGAVTAGHWVAGLTSMCTGSPETRPAAHTSFEACRSEAARLGGSHAQRSIVDRTAEAMMLATDAAATPA